MKLSSIYNFFLITEKIPEFILDKINLDKLIKIKRKDIKSKL